ncbi:hypothetical protein FB382_001865 [Nocardioides ginsengisegetis]|uniref:Uncharacterized protein n=1 Tax=Nocardioides ginsengisegetis TaxID=661491 RepID=A0A7W3IZW6_9ACTN|nr:hypothetical protein [Nocardioides ginsengisegetis]MBA8803574.1 hypothetical protein [Nocardioides ginsengisegetis]
MKTISFDLKQPNALPATKAALRAAGFDATTGSPRSGDTGTAIIDISDVSEDREPEAFRIVKQHAPYAAALH